jgi:hypothetical protein
MMMLAKQGLVGGGHSPSLLVARFAAYSAAFNCHRVDSSPSRV